MKQKCVLLLMLTLSLVLSGCSIAKPMTKRIDNTASGIGDIDQFQYYVSRNIVLTKTTDPEIIGEIKLKGSLRVTNNKDVIQITSTTKGALLHTQDSGDYKEYHVAFETDNDNCLRFRQNKGGSDQRMYLQYDHPTAHVVCYGGDYYQVEWAGTENLGGSKVRAKIDDGLAKFGGFFKGVPYDSEDNPYLLVKMNIKVKEKEKYRKASGRKPVIK